MTITKLYDNGYHVAYTGDVVIYYNSKNFYGRLWKSDSIFMVPPMDWECE